MSRKLFEKLEESLKSVLPICLIVLALHLTIARMPLGTFALFLSGTFFLVLGMSIFTLGADMATMPIGELIGHELTKSKKIWILILGCFILGFTVTIAEPDLQVLTKQVPAIPDGALVAAVAAGVGLFLVLAILRIIFRVKLAYMFIVLYLTVFLVAAVAAPDFLAVAFDSGGVTTGPITVPFILALGAGVSVLRGGKNEEEDCFGLCALCSVGPILTVLILGIFFDSSASGYAFETASSVDSFQELVLLYANGFRVFVKEVIMALLPIVIIFLILNAVRLKLPKNQMFKIIVGLVYTVAGLTVFLVGVNIGFMPVGTYLGSTLASLPYNWILIPISLLFGLFIVMAEPAIYLLNRQVEEITSGAISKRMMMIGLSSGVGIALVLSMIRIMKGFSIWFILLPGYLIALVLTAFVPEIFTAIAFDSGGVAAGTMAAAFLLPFAMGACKALGGNVMTDAFGIIAMVAMMPLVTLQIIGLSYKIKLKRMQETAEPEIYAEISQEIPTQAESEAGNHMMGESEDSRTSEEGDENGEQ
ncbi:DUF1538 domain-containing protein [Caproiciproducens sp. LBM24188]|nr:DUF1538 domain-containing protein [Oscillospiraceae bacterium]HHV32517.1 DUF1538 domain-containing protein [Clostridiales bacterium]